MDAKEKSMKKVVLIPDSFKGTLTSVEICTAIGECVHRHFPACEVVALPVADGGEGTVDCFLYALPNGQRVAAPVQDPFGREITGFYGRFGELAVIEMAAAAGLPLVEHEKDPRKATTYGVGQLIAHAVDNGATQIVLGLGGSATNDGGCGCAAALGAKFYNSKGEPFIPVGGTLQDITLIDLQQVEKKLRGVQVTAMCDVENPLCGPNGAAEVFAPQKGADKEMVQLLDAGLCHMSEVIGRQFGIKEIAQLQGAGAAGGFGAGVVAFLQGNLKRGIETVLDTLAFDTHLTQCDVVFTGEGRIDGQSLQGKVISGVAARAVKKRVPVVALVGDVGEGIEKIYDCGVSAVFSINRVAVPFSEARLRSRKDLVSTAEDVLRLWKVAGNNR